MTIKELADEVFSLTNDRYVSVQLSIDRHIDVTKNVQRPEVSYRIYDHDVEDSFYGHDPESILNAYKEALGPKKTIIDGLEDVSHEQLKGQDNG